MAEQTSDNTYKIVRNHDVFAYKSPNDNIYPPEVGNGQVVLSQVVMVDSNGGTHSPIDGSSFSNGLIYSRLIPGGSLTFLAKKYYPDQKASKTLSLRNKVTTWFLLPSDEWFPNTWRDEIYTAWY